MPPPPPPLPDELVEEVLLRLPPENPAGLVHAGLVCTRWCRLVSDPGFRRRFREFHRRPPMLGVFYNIYDEYKSTGAARFIPTCALCFPRSDSLDLRVLDARHGRALFHEGGTTLVVWEPITDEMREIPFPQKFPVPWTAAVLCSAAAAGACDHLDCHRGPFLVVFVCCKCDRYGSTVVYTYLSDSAAWSEPVWARNYFAHSSMGSALVGNALYSGNMLGEKALKYDLELRRASLIPLPSCPSLMDLLTTTEDGGLGLVNKDGSKLYMWSRKGTHEVDAKWERRVIELKTVFPADVVTDYNLRVIGSGVGIIFVRTGDEVYKINLKTYKVKKVYEGTADKVIPYMSFYTPALEAACSGEEPGAGGSSA